jgi:hypothetical protein
VTLITDLDAYVDKGIITESPYLIEDDEIIIGKYIVIVGARKKTDSLKPDELNIAPIKPTIILNPAQRRMGNLLSAAPPTNPSIHPTSRPFVPLTNTQSVQNTQNKPYHSTAPLTNTNSYNSSLPQSNTTQPRPVHYTQTQKPTQDAFFKIPVPQPTTQSLGQSATKQPLNTNALNSKTPAQSTFAAKPPPQPPQPPNGAFILHQKPLIYVSPRLNSSLRPHQREGVKFLFERISGSAISGHHGVILMDDVGLGKTLQCIALLDSMLSYPYIRSKKVIICCPNILVNMWDREIIRWLGAFAFMITVVTAEKTTDGHIQSFVSNLRPHILIISYEQCRKYGHLLKNATNSLLICDEAHRLKSTSNDNKTISILKQIPTKLRILLTATPIQNNLGEFYAMAHFANPGFLSEDLNKFTNTFIKPITAMQDSRNSNVASVQSFGQETTQKLMELVNRFCLRRTHDTIGGFLPPKTNFLLFLKPTQIQINVMSTIIRLYQSDTKQYQVLPVLNLLRKVATSPYLLTFSSGTKATSNIAAIDSDGDQLTTSMRLIEQVKHLIPTPSTPFQALQSSSKMLILFKMVENYLPYTNIIIISNYTETLHYLKSLFQSINPTTFQCLNLDGSCDNKSKKATIDRFNKKVISPQELAKIKSNNPHNNNQQRKSQMLQSNSGYGARKLTKAQQAKLDNSLENQDDAINPTKHSILFLSAKAAGAGLNLTNGCVQIILDANWNPAIDVQAGGRMWRVGNHQHVMSFGLITNGSIDEHIFLRQLFKNDIAASLLTRGNKIGENDVHFSSIANNINNNNNNNSNNGANLNKLTPDELRKVLLFQHELKMTYTMLKMPSNVPNSVPKPNLLSKHSDSDIDQAVSQYKGYYDSDDEAEESNNSENSNSINIISPSLNPPLKQSQTKVQYNYQDSDDDDDDNGYDWFSSRKKQTTITTKANPLPPPPILPTKSMSFESSSDDAETRDEYQDVYDTDDDSDAIKDKKGKKKVVNTRKKRPVELKYDEDDSSDDGYSLGSRNGNKRFKADGPDDKNVFSWEHVENLQNAADAADAADAANTPNHLQRYDDNGEQNQQNDPNKPEDLNGGYQFYSQNNISQLTEFTFPIILSSTSQSIQLTEESPEFEQFLKRSNQDIFSPDLIMYCLTHQINFSTTDENDAKVNETNSSDDVDGSIPVVFNPNNSNSGNTNQTTKSTNSLSTNATLINTNSTSVPTPTLVLETKSILPGPSLLESFKQLPRNMFESSSDDE